MSVSNGKITAPISVKDVYDCLGVGKTANGYDLGYICSNVHGKINKWALHKPISFPSVASVTLNNIKSKYCGLSPAPNDALLKGCANYSGTQVNNNVATVEASQREYPYSPPTGGASSPYRLADFVDYNYNAKVPDSGWVDFTIKKEDLYTYSTTNIESEGTEFDWYVKNTFGSIPYFNLKFDAPSWATVGNGSGVELPITWIVGDRLVTSEYWRIAFAVYIPTLTTTGKWHLFTSRKALKSASSTADIADLIPSLATNTFAADKIYNSNQNSFSAIPCLVKNARISFTAIAQNKLQSYITLGTDSVIYSVPSGQKSVTIKIDDGTAYPTIPGVTIKGSSPNKQWYIGIVGLGTTTGSPHYYPIQGIAVVRTAAISQDTYVSLKFQYTHAESNGIVTSDETFTQTIKAGTTLNVNGHTLYGEYAVKPNPAVSIVSGSIVWDKP